MIKTQLLARASVLTIAALGAVPAFAAGTTAGSTISNTASVTYQVGGVTQTPPPNATAVFTVDRKVSLTITEPGNATTTVTPGQSGAVTTFLVTNTSNAVLDFGLGLVQPNGGTAAHGGTDNFDVTGVTLYVNTGASAGSATYDPANSVAVTYLDELAADASRYVFAVANVPLGRANNDVAGVTLTATSAAGGTAGSQGANLTNDNATANNNAVMETVFADTAGATDAANDGKFSARDDYTVSASALTVAKIATIVSDPINGTANPKMIPGATVEYCIQVTNAAGGAAANNVAITDVLPTQTTFVTGSILVNGNLVAGACTGGSAGGNYDAPTTTVTGTIPTVAAGTTKTLYFRTTVN